MNVKDKVILITGGAGGLGSEMGKLLSKNGAKVCLLDIDADRGEETLKAMAEEGLTATFYKIDLTSEDNWKAVVQTVLETFGRIDVLINNAGINIRKPVEEMSFDEWNTMMRVNTGSTFLGTKAVLPVMKEQKGGAIINTSSVCGLIGHKYTPEAYTASKGAITMFTKAIASRYGCFGVRCNSIHPSTVMTPLVEKMLQDPQRAAERLGEVPLGRLATSDDVAQAVLYLCSEEASFINGVSMPIDGGVTCY
ncbi:MAG: SDR family oxidoreductase [Lachnospiraceae bacterium]|nr:SDR family oxidoreductase [Lachnospiraceae bacterium]